MAPLLLHMPEEEAFVLLVRMMYGYSLREVFRSTMYGLRKLFFQLESLMESELPQLLSHFQVKGWGMWQGIHVGLWRATSRMAERPKRKYWIQKMPWRQTFWVY